MDIGPDPVLLVNGCARSGVGPNANVQKATMANAIGAAARPAVAPNTLMRALSGEIAANSSLYRRDGDLYRKVGCVSRSTTMSDAVALLTTRRSVKPIEMTGPAPSPADIDTMLTVASRVPDHGKLAPWRFVVFEGDARQEIGEQLAEIFRTDRPEATADQIEFERNRLARAPLVIAVVSRAAPHAKIPEWEQVLSAGAATMNLVTAAHALGYAANWITEWYAYDPRALKAMGLAEGERIAGFVHIGRVTRPSEDRPRPALSDIVTRFGA